ncbi:hypothetical protein [Rhodoferax sp. BLA1]|uniref:hypothetical protein n=1 Tax=Rhodoferax sp. BLA1 TaxID=2576062 RepID=UPI0015D1871B|nr:hypothetical protein [Rhodoferax sp. BLA1]
MYPLNQTRRRYVTSALSVVALFSMGAWSSRTQAATKATASFAQANLLRLARQPDAARVGEAMLPQLAYPTPQALVQTLASRLSGFLGSDLRQVCDTGQLQLAFQKAVQDDFAQGRCQTVSGWVLTHTEVELCALAALSAHHA